MVWLALFVPMLAQGPKEPPTAFWAPSASVALIEAKRRHWPILAAVTTDPFRGSRMLAMLDAPRNPYAYRDFIMLHVSTPEEYRTLDPKATVPMFSQCVFFSPTGTRIKRSAGMIFDSDFQRQCDLVRWALPFVVGKVPKSRWKPSEVALISAMTGDTDRAEKVIPKLPPEDRQEIWLALADEYRASGRFQTAVNPLRQAITSERDEHSRASLRATLGFTYMRLAQNPAAVQQFRQALTSQTLREEEKLTLERMLERVSGPDFGP